MVSDWAEGAPRGHSRGSGRDLRTPPDRLGKLPALRPPAPRKQTSPRLESGRAPGTSLRPRSRQTAARPAAPPPAPAGRPRAARRFRGTRAGSRGSAERRHLGALPGARPARKCAGGGLPPGGPQRARRDPPTHTPRPGAAGGRAEGPGRRAHL